MIQRILTAAALIVLLLGTSVGFAAELPTGGGEPGAALLRHFEAVRSGDANRIKEETHPDEHAMLDAAIASGEFEMMIDFMQAFLPDNVAVHGGTSDGDGAEVSFSGDMDGAPVKGTATMARVNGRWMVQGISMSD
ncbi:MAG TPA: hypothetical protein PKZ76_14255 [Xanthomonadaceae bacterium]|nr:hypothetical protein [Xanthomonadaceae bacterium]